MVRPAGTAGPVAGSAHALHGFWQRALLPGEFLFTLLAGSRPVPGSRGTFLVAYHRHRGAPVGLPDGTRVAPGDLVAEIHFWNRRIAGRAGTDPQAVTWAFIRDMRADLGALARAMASGALPRAAVCGASPLAEAAGRFGFLVRPLPRGWRREALTRWQSLLRRTFRPRALHTGASPATAEIWMAPGELIARYGGSGRTQDPGRAQRKGGAGEAAPGSGPVGG